jgi:L-asparaginase II
MQSSYPENPVLARVWRGDHIESQHRGTWALVDSSGTVLDGVGAYSDPFFVRSTIKCVQALPLIESGAAERYGYGPADLALAVSSHNGEACHTDGVADMLGRLQLTAGDLQCGAQPPADPEARAGLLKSGEFASRIHNNCSGKHAGFLALAKHLDVDVQRYIDESSAGQGLVRAAVLEMCGVADGDLGVAIDGCSAPTFRMPLTALAVSFARVANPDGLGTERRAACTSMLDAVASHPRLIAGRHKRLCTDLAAIGGGKLFPKIGAEAVYAVGLRGSNRALAVKVDDGSFRGLHAIVVHLLRRLDFLTSAEFESLSVWDGAAVKNWAGQEVGHIEVTS